MEGSDRGSEGGEPGSLAGVSSDFEDSLLRRVAGSSGSESGTEARDHGVPPVSSEIDGKYRLERLLGRGGMGFVFAARHLTTGRPVAIKWMLRRGDVEELRKRFVREARAAGRIRHPNVIDIHDVVSDEQRTYLVMELLEGESLRERMNRGPLDAAEAVPIALSMLDGLQEAHQKGVIHRDLKPENVFLCSSPPCTKLVDFGISMLAETRPLPESNLTRTGYFVGTPVYTALERLREKQPFDHRVDLYSVGVILYEALTGALPFSGRTPSELTYQLALSNPRPLRERRAEIPPALEAVVLRAMARDPTARFQDAQSLAEALRAALQAPASRRRRRAAWAVASALTAGVLAVSAAGALQGRSPSVVGSVGPAARAAPAVAQAQPAPVLARETSAEPFASAAPRTAAATRKPPARAPQPRPSSSTSAAVPSAELSVVVFPYGDVWVDGRRVGSSPARVSLAPGTHVVSGGRTFGERETRVVLGAGEARELVLSWKTDKGGSGSEGDGPAEARRGSTREETDPDDSPRPSEAADGVGQRNR